MAASIGSKLFEPSGGMEEAPSSVETSTPTSAAKARPFRFESSGVVAGGDMKKKLQFGGIVVGVIAIAGAGLWMSAREKNGEAQKPILTQAESQSNLQPLSGGQVVLAAQAPLAPSSTPSVTRSVTSEISGQGVEFVEENSVSPAAAETVAKEVPEVKPTAVARVRSKPLDHIQTPMLVKSIEEKQVLVEFEGVEYIVRSGEYLPDRKTVFIGFDTRESIMRTSAGDHRINRP